MPAILDAPPPAVAFKAAETLTHAAERAMFELSASVARQGELRASTPDINLLTQAAAGPAQQRRVPTQDVRAVTLGLSDLATDLQAPALMLSRLLPGVRARVQAVRAEGAESEAERLLEMGLTPGTEVRVLRCAWGQDPMLQLQLRGYSLSLRRSLAARVQVTYPVETP